jgi:hypothetical protein
MKNINFFFIILFTLSLSNCKKDDPLTVVKPKEYFPAFPGSYWYYTNGEVSTVSKEYVAHSYPLSVNSTEYSEEKLVPFIDNKYYLYEYGITQNSMKYPLKKLLSESLSDKWVVNEVDGQKIYRQTTEKLDSIYLKMPAVNGKIDSVKYKDVIVVIEYMDTLGVTRWNTKEFYSKNIGLIRVDVNNPYDVSDAIIFKQLTHYHINN